MKCLKFRGLRAAWVFFALFQLMIFSGFAQDTTCSFVPAVFSVLDTIGIEVEYGDSLNPVTNATQVDFFFEYAGIELRETATMEMNFDNSWFILPTDSPSDYDYTYNLVPNTNLIHVKVVRLSGTASGYGRIGGGVGLLVVEDNLRRAGPAPQPTLKLISLEVVEEKVPWDFSISPNPVHPGSQVKLSLSHGRLPSPIEQVEVLSLAGARLHWDRVAGEMQVPPENLLWNLSD